MGDIRGGADGVEVEVGGDFSDGLVGLGMLGEGDEGSVGAEDAGFFASDLGEGVAEVVLVVEGDVGDDGDEGGDNVGGVETATEAYFEDGDVDFLFRKIRKGEGGEDFEEAGVVWEGALADEAFGGGVDLEVEAGEVFVRDLEAVDLDAFVDAREVGRGVEGGAVAGGREDARERGGGATLAVGSGDEDGGEGQLRIAEGCGEDAHVGEVEFAARRCGGGGGQLLAEGVEMVDRCVVGHGSILGDVGGRPRIAWMNADENGVTVIKRNKH